VSNVERARRYRQRQKERRAAQTQDAALMSAQATAMEKS